MNLKTLLAIASLIIFAGFVYAGSVQDNDTGAGRQIGTSASQKIAFHGATPVGQRSGTAQAALSTNVIVGSNASLSGVDGSTNTVFMVNTNQLQSVLRLLIELRASMVEKGLIKGE